MIKKVELELKKRNKKKNEEQNTENHHPSPKFLKTGQYKNNQKIDKNVIEYQNL